MDARIRERLIAGAGVLLALVIGWQVAEGHLALAALIGAGVALLTGSLFLGVPADVACAGLVLAGYLIGNRGFAQLHPPGVPLLPAEAALALVFTLGFWRWSRTQRLPIRRDVLNAAVAAWIVVGAIRLPFDFRLNGFVAIRDFAMVYYALFFFAAQDWASVALNRRWLDQCLVCGFALVAPAFWLFLAQPGWIDRFLTVWGTPLIFVKSDVAGSFLAAGVVLFAERYAHRRTVGWLVAAALSLAGLATSNNRAAAVALVGATLWVAILRRWRTLGVIATLVAAGGLTLVGHAVAGRKPLTATPLYRAYEAAVSILDVRGTRAYATVELGDKPDNNRFRMVWWQTVAARTWAENRWLGVGFGPDLAEEFLRLYSPDVDETFSARSPHNFVLSIFARMGLVGSAVFLVVLIALAARTWQSRAAPADSGETGYWLLAWAILFSACLGVVLEGPMAAMVFWTVLGLANGNRARDADPSKPEGLSNGLTRNTGRDRDIPARF